MKKIYLSIMAVMSLFIVNAQTDLFVSEYLEGSSNNKALEIYNGTGSEVTLRSGDTHYYFMMKITNQDGTKDWSGASVFLFKDGAKIVDGDVYVLANTNATLQCILDAKDEDNDVTGFNGNDPIALVKDVNNNGTYEEGTDEILDVLGWMDNSDYWGKDSTFVRKSEITEGVTTWDRSEWNGYKKDECSFLGYHGKRDITISEPYNGYVTTSTEVTVKFIVDKFVVTDDASGDGYIKYYLNGTATDKKDTDPIEITGLSAGSQEVILQLVDNLGDPLDPNIADTLYFTVVDINSIQAVTIHDIQYTTDEYSDYKDDTVKTSGIVAGVSNKGYYLQDGEGAWSGLYVYDKDNTPVMGDSVTVVGIVKEYQYNDTDEPLTELTKIMSFEIINSGNALISTTVSVEDAVKEEYEGVLVKVNTLKCTTEEDNYGVASFNNDAIKSDDDIYRDFSPVLNTYYNIRGLMTYSYGAIKIIPRMDSDIEEATSVQLINNTALSIYPNPVKNTLIVKGQNIKNVEIIDINGRTVQTINNTSSINVEKLNKGIYFVKVKTATNTKVLKMIKL